MNKIIRILIIINIYLLINLHGFASTIEEDAIEISKEAPETKELLSKHPDAFAIVNQNTLNGTSYLVVDWWTNEQIERKLQYPNVQVWISIQDGSILFSGIPRTEIEYPMPTPTEDLYSSSNNLLITSLIIISAIIVTFVISKKKR